MVIKTHIEHHLYYDNHAKATHVYWNLHQKCKKSENFDEIIFTSMSTTFRKNSKDIIKIEQLVNVIILHIYDDGDFETKEHYSLSDFEDDLFDDVWD